VPNSTPSPTAPQIKNRCIGFPPLLGNRLKAARGLLLRGDKVAASLK
jgi:hypothetical protein